MQGKGLRTLVLIFVLGMSAYVLYPTVQWYFLLSPEQKRILNQDSEELLLEKQNLSESLRKLRDLVPDPKERLKKLDGEGFSMNLRPRVTLDEEVVLNLDNKNTLLKRIFGSEDPLEKKEFLSLAEEIHKIQNSLETFHNLKGLRQKVVKLGLDLDGGTHLTLAVNRRDLIRRLRFQFEGLGLKDRNPIEELIQNEGDLDESKIEFDRDLIRENLGQNQNNRTPQNVEDGSTDSSLKDLVNQRETELISEYQESMQQELSTATENALVVIRNRIDQFGVAETTISRGLGDTIFIELPRLDQKNVDDTVKTITQAGELQFQIVHEEWMERIPPRFLGQGEYQNYISPLFVEETNEGLNFTLEAREFLEKRQIILSSSVEGSSLYSLEETDEFGNATIVAYAILKNRIQVPGQNLSRSDIGYDPQTGIPHVLFELDSEGARIFRGVTRENIGNRMAIVLDGKIKSAPSIRQEIGGSGQITLGANPSIEEIRQLVAILKAGVLPAKLDLVSVLSIGPKLGKANIEAGRNALIVGMVFVLLFMVIYYRLAGIVAVFALILNLYILFSILSAFGFTLTLPGLAGIVLTVGIAVDANVIIFERMREEIRDNKSVRGILSSSYEKAFSAILDSNLTTIFAAFILSQIGSGIIQGFGFTLMWGIATSMFTALFVTRLVFDFTLDWTHMKKIYV